MLDNKNIINNYVQQENNLSNLEFFSKEEQRQDLFKSISSNLNKIIKDKYLYSISKLNFYTHIHEKYKNNEIDSIHINITFNLNKKEDLTIFECSFNKNEYIVIKTLFKNSLNTNEVVFKKEDVYFNNIQKNIDDLIVLINEKRDSFIEEVEKQVSIKNDYGKKLQKEINNFVFSEDLVDKTKKSLGDFFPSKNLSKYIPKIYLSAKEEFNNEAPNYREQFLVIIFSLKEENEKGYGGELINLFQFDISLYNKNIKSKQLILQNSKILVNNSLKTFINNKLKKLFLNEIKKWIYS